MDTKKKIGPCGYTQFQIIELADKLAEKVEFKVGDKEGLLPVIERFGGTIVEGNTWDLTASLRTLDEEVENKPSNKKFEIKVPAMFPLRERFSIAQEFAHYILHTRFGDIPIKQFKSSSDRCELVRAESMIFAHAFLMPTKDFRRIVNSYAKHKMPIDYTNLAAMFYVPWETVRNRLDMHKYYQKCKKQLRKAEVKSAV